MRGVHRASLISCQWHTREALEHFARGLATAKYIVRDVRAAGKRDWTRHTGSAEQVRFTNAHELASSVARAIR